MVAQCWTSDPPLRPPNIMAPDPASKRQRQMAAREVAFDLGRNKRCGGGVQRGMGTTSPQIMSTWEDMEGVSRGWRSAIGGV